MIKLFRATRTDKHLISQWWWTIDRPLLICVCTLYLIGLGLVMAASPAVAERIGSSYSHFIFKHLLFVGPSFLLMIGLSFLDAKKIWRIGTVVLCMALLSMIMVLFVGTEIKGAQRWISIGPLSLQPSELVKPSFAIFTAWLMARQKEQPEFPGNFLAASAYFLVITLLMLQPDLGMSFVVSLIFAVQIFLAGFPFRYMVGFLMIGIIGLFGAYYGFDHVHSRINRFLDPTSGDNYQIERSIEAFRAGGLIGEGPGQGQVKMTIPDAHADFIFSVAAEEFGFIFIVALITIYAYIIRRILRHLGTQENMFVILAAGGLLMMFGMQAMIHMGSAMHILPTKGMTLPFISYGGSSLLSMGFGCGVLLALTRRTSRSNISRMSLSGTGAEGSWVR